MNEVDGLFPDLDALKAYLATVEDASARELIYGTVVEEILTAPSAKGTATEIRDWLSQSWGITDAEAEVDMQELMKSMQFDEPDA